MEERIDISGLTKAEVLAVLYNYAILRRNPFAFIRILFSNHVMTATEAQAVITQRGFKIRKLHSRKLRVNLRGDHLDPRRYDKLQGKGVAREAITHLRETGGVERPDRTLTEEEKQQLPPFLQKALRRAEKLEQRPASKRRHRSSDSTTEE